jgi:hypothetical protein
MELKPSITYSQEPAIGPYPEPDGTNPSLLISLRSILILPSHLLLGIPNIFFASGFPTKIFYEFHIYPMCATFPDRLRRTDLVTLTFSLRYSLFSSKINNYMFHIFLQVGIFEVGHRNEAVPCSTKGMYSTAVFLSVLANLCMPLFCSSKTIYFIEAG